MDINKDLVAASARPLVLGILAEGENYGYAIIKRVHELSQGRIAWKEGMLYPVLHRLEQEGLIESHLRTGETGRQRKYYRLKKTGARNLALYRQQWQTVHETLRGLWGTDPCLT